MDYRLVFLDFHGRIARTWYWTGTLIMTIASGVLNFVAGLLYRWEPTLVTYARRRGDDG